jgi:carbon monoxide dehydrogenase subunit G
MAMTMNGECQLAVPRETVWAKLNDTEILKACIPGCEQFDKLSVNSKQCPRPRSGQSKRSSKVR